MGKTRLVAEARASAEEAGFEVLAARGGELEEEFAYGVVRQLFEPLLATASDDLRAELLSGAAALAAPLFDERQLAVALEDPTDSSFATLHGLYWLAANLALRRPTLLAIDDLHWVDAPSLRWLIYLTRRLEGLPLLVVGALRPPGQSQNPELLTELLADPATALVSPAALGIPSVATLARKILAAEPDERFCAACHEATGGNPLFIRALLETLAAEGVAPTAEAAARVHEVGPEPVARAVTLRLSRLPPEAAKLARAVAILDGAEPPLAAALAGLDPDVAASAAALLARADILRAEPRLEFVHPVVRAAVNEEISPGERATEHRRAAALLAEAGAEPERAAAHLMLVPPDGEAFVLPILREAAARAVARGAADTAVAYLRRALEETFADEAGAEILAQLGMIERLVDVPAAANDLGEALRLADDPARQAQIALEYGRVLFWTGRNSEAIEVFQAAIEQQLGPEQQELRQLLQAELIGAGWWEAELYPPVQRLLRDVSDEELGGGSLSDALLATLSFYEMRRGIDRERTVALAERSLASGSLEGEGTAAVHFAALPLSFAGMTDAAAAVYDRAVADARRRGDIFGAGRLLGFRGLLETERGDLISAAEDLREAVEIMQERGALLNLYYDASFLADLLLERGEGQEAEATLALTGLGEQFPASVHSSFFGDVRGKLRLETNRPAEALADFTEVGRILEPLEIHNPAFRAWRSHAALALHALGRDDEGRELAAEELALARRWGAPRPIGVALRALGLVRGGRQGESHLREAVEVLAGSSARLEHAKVLVDLGAMLRRTNRRKEARDPLQQGLELARKGGAKPLAERAHTELIATGARPRRLVFSGLEALTPSERRVAAMAAAGMINREIAQALFVTAGTVEVHLSSAYRKLEISSRSQLPQALAEPADAQTETEPATLTTP